jgi:hypothetical protein
MRSLAFNVLNPLTSRETLKNKWMAHANITILFAVFWAILWVTNCLAAEVVDEDSVVQWPVEFGGNGHYYQFVRYDSIPGLTWDEARSSAESACFQGIQGHLLTITSKQENDFLRSRRRVFPALRTDTWIGLFQPKGSAEPDGGWRWVTDEPLDYTNWFPGEPNNDAEISNDPENYAIIWDNDLLSWNDTLPNFLGFGARGHIVEFSTSLVPEPSGLAIAGVFAGAAMATALLRNRSG